MQGQRVRRSSPTRTLNRDKSTTKSNVTITDTSSISHNPSDNSLARTFDAKNDMKNSFVRIVRINGTRLLLPFLRPSLKNIIDDLDEIEELGHGDILQMGPTLEPTKKLEALLLGCLDDLSSDFRLQTSTNRISAGIDVHLDLGVSRRPNEEDNSRLLLGFKALGSDRSGEVLIRHTELIHDFHSFLRYFQYSLPTIPL